MTKQFLNFDNKQTNYPDLFLGADLGLTDTINVTYPEIEEAALNMRAKFWTENEIDLSSDKLQWNTLSKNIQEIIKLNLSWQSFADSLVTRAPEQTLLAVCSNPEMEYWFINQIFNESIHSRTYMHIVRTVFPNPEEVMAELRDNKMAQKRAKAISEEFNKLHTLVTQYHLGYASVTPKIMREQIAKVLAVMYILEGLQFFSSFAMNFSLAEQGIMTGMADLLRMIARDEVLHRDVDRTVIGILMRNPLWKAAFEAVMPEIVALFYEIVQSEIDWSRYVMTGREIVGLNAALLEDFIHYLARQIASGLGIEYTGKYIAQNPLHWFHKYLDSDSLQVAPQERQITNYSISAIDNDTSEFELEW